MLGARRTPQRNSRQQTLTPLSIPDEAPIATRGAACLAKLKGSCRSSSPQPPPNAPTSSAFRAAEGPEVHIFVSPSRPAVEGGAALRRTAPASGRSGKKTFWMSVHVLVVQPTPMVPICLGNSSRCFTMLLGSSWAGMSQRWDVNGLGRTTDVGTDVGLKID